MHYALLNGRHSKVQVDSRKVYVPHFILLRRKLKLHISNNLKPNRKYALKKLKYFEP